MDLRQTPLLFSALQFLMVSGRSGDNEAMGQFGGRAAALTRLNDTLERLMSPFEAGE